MTHRSLEACDAASGSSLLLAKTVSDLLRFTTKLTKSLSRWQGVSTLSGMLTGKIRSLNADKGFGFIKPSAGGADLFFHCSAVDANFEALKLEQSVQYEVDDSAEKPRAKQVVTGMAASHPKPQTAGKGYEGRSPGKQPAGRRPNQSGQSFAGRRRPEIEYTFGFITKLPRKNPIGFISSVQGGPEYYFEPDDVKGKKFVFLRVGDYVRFIARSNAEDPKQPLAKSVMVVPKPINRQENHLKRHPKARRKKPTWKSR
ncbi:MAG: cold-shock protein [Bythopirellula sp.]